MLIDTDVLREAALLLMAANGTPVRRDPSFGRKQVYRGKIDGRTILLRTSREILNDAGKVVAGCESDCYGFGKVSGGERADS